MNEKLLDYKLAQKEVLARVAPGGHESLPLSKAAGRVLARDLVAGWDLPRYDNSAMDGFALRSEDGQADTQLEIIDTVAAGAAAMMAVRPGSAVRIMTGAVIPPGSDAVIPVEKVTVTGDRVRLRQAVAKGDNIRWQGEDLRQGATALTTGTRLSPAELGLLATFGQHEVDVFRRPKVAVLATGNELVPPGSELAATQIYDCNTTALCAAVAEAGGEPVPLDIARDDIASLSTLIDQGLQSDLLVTAAGASVGEFDLVRKVLARKHAEEIFSSVSIKPGKPTAFSLCAGTPVFCLPGNPVSALVTFELFVRPALLRMQGRSDAQPATVRLPLAEPMRKKPARTLFARVRINNTVDGLSVVSAGSQQTGIMTALVQADALAILPDGQSEFAKGEKVDVLLLRQK